MLQEVITNHQFVSFTGSWPSCFHCVELRFILGQVSSFGLLYNALHTLTCSFLLYIKHSIFEMFMFSGGWGVVSCVAEAGGSCKNKSHTNGEPSTDCCLSSPPHPSCPPWLCCFSFCMFLRFLFFPPDESSSASWEKPRVQLCQSNKSTFAEMG